MAIQPPSDIVLDVARAADPLEYRASVERLYSLQKFARVQTTEREESSFADLAQTTSASEVRDNLVSDGLIQQVHIRPQSVQSKEAAVFRNFEAFVLQTFVESMFATDIQSIFGKGQAGQIWKSMMAEQLAKEFAVSGGIGIAQMLVFDHMRKETGTSLSTLETDQELGAKDHRILADEVTYKNELDLVSEDQIKTK
ncbi:MULTISPECIES: rod-binding protein [unclassified Bartonella]|uniref:rod-binding protein n=1 Tax=unclassified Bartonella TaxID=2645622 RepID=UPI000999FA3F|nr:MULTISPECIES: rod-binding protein [unclassified Bartonella]AQX23147.1 Rod binding protein [Bartonella sp. 11B]AQX23554.1 Rod binding protein [Bartonella sp. 114]AQX25602.1 Rod binding protein [Bartonella sp. Coyote22sub2]